MPSIFKGVSARLTSLLLKCVNRLIVSSPHIFYHSLVTYPLFCCG